VPIFALVLIGVFVVCSLFFIFAMLVVIMSPATATEEEVKSVLSLEWKTDWELRSKVNELKRVRESKKEVSIKEIQSHLRSLLYGGVAEYRERDVYITAAWGPPFWHTRTEFRLKKETIDKPRGNGRKKARILPYPKLEPALSFGWFLFIPLTYHQYLYIVMLEPVRR
jgi:hypothetical protein